MFGLGIAFVIVGLGLVVVGTTGVTPNNQRTSDAFTGVGLLTFLVGCAGVVGAVANRWFYG